MRTTLNIDDDIMLAAKELAKQEGKTAGQVLSELARKGLNSNSEAGSDDGGSTEFFGFRPLPSRGALITNDFIDSLREQEGV